MTCDETSREESSISGERVNFSCLSCLWCDLTFWKGWKKTRWKPFLPLSCLPFSVEHHFPLALSLTREILIWAGIFLIYFFKCIMMTFKVKRRLRGAGGGRTFLNTIRVDEWATMAEMKRWKEFKAIQLFENLQFSWGKFSLEIKSARAMWRSDTNGMQEWESLSSFQWQ